MQYQESARPYVCLSGTHGLPAVPSFPGPDPQGHGILEADEQGCSGLPGSSLLVSNIAEPGRSKGGVKAWTSEKETRESCLHSLGSVASSFLPSIHQRLSDSYVPGVLLGIGNKANKIAKGCRIVESMVQDNLTLLTSGQASFHVGAVCAL